MTAVLEQPAVTGAVANAVTARPTNMAEDGRPPVAEWTAPSHHGRQRRQEPDILLDRYAALPAGHPERRALRDRVITAWLPYARRLARRFSHRGEPLDDLYQVAALGLIKAIDRYDPGHANTFGAYAMPTILGEVKRHFRDRCWSVRVTRELQERVLDLSHAIDTLPLNLGRSPTVTDLAAHLGLTECQVMEGLEAAHAYHTHSLNMPLRGDDDGYTGELGDLFGDDDARLEGAENRAAIRPVLAALPSRERRILYLRLVDHKTQSEIGAELGVSQMHVSRLLRKALGRVRDALSS